MADTLLVTGGAGFIGSNFARIARDRGYSVTVLDKLGYAGCRASLAALDRDPEFRFVQGAIEDRDLVERLIADISPVAIINFAAETHVDRSIDDPEAFVVTNVLAVQRLLSVIRGRRSELPDGFRFVQISTDEVFGVAEESDFTEATPYNPNSPYAASKAAADHLVRAAHKTFGLPVLITNCSNNYGPYQFPEKLIPLMILKALHEKPLPVYGDGLQMRDWLYVDDHCDAILAALENGRVGGTYVVGGRCCIPNIEIVHGLCDRLDSRRPRPGGGSYRDLITHVPDRPGHDRRYAVDPSHIESELGWRAKVDLQSGLDNTIAWYLDNPGWWEPLLSERYSGERLGLGCPRKEPI